MQITINLTCANNRDLVIPDAQAAVQTVRCVMVSYLNMYIVRLIKPTVACISSRFYFGSAISMSLHLYSLAWLSLQTKVQEDPQLVSWGGEKGNHLWCWPLNGLKDWQEQVDKTRQSAGRNNMPGICYKFGWDALATWIWKEGSNSLKTSLQCTDRDSPYWLPADCLRGHTGGCNGSPAPLLPGGEESIFRCPLLISLVISAIVMQNFCPAILKAVDGAIDSTINENANQVKVYLDEQY